MGRDRQTDRQTDRARGKREGGEGDERGVIKGGEQRDGMCESERGERKRGG